jgi:hypothetical protein
MNEWLLIPAALFLWGIIKLWRQDGFFVPLPMGTVRTMLKIAGVRKGDVLYDLGSGDGRTVIEAAKLYGIHSVGIEHGHLIYAISKLRVGLSGAGDKVKLIKGDIFKEDLRVATIVTFYLTPKLNRMLKPKLEKELKKGTRVVSAAHEMPGWTPQKKIKTGHFWTYLYKL